MTGDTARKGELLEQFLHPFLVLRDVWIEFAVGALEPGIGHNPRPPVARANDVDHVQSALLDDAIEMNIDKVQARRRAPVSDQSRLDVLFPERLFQERV